MSSKISSVKTLEMVPPEKAFYFYYDIGKPLGVVANSLREFGALVKTVEVQSLEFHSKRGDFERWIAMLGDGDLSKAMVKIKEGGLKGEKLRAELVRVVQTRVRQLQRVPTRK